MRKRRSNEKLKSHDNQLRRSRRMANIENIIKNNRIHQRRHKEQDKSTKKGNELNRKTLMKKILLQKTKYTVQIQRKLMTNA